MHVLNGGVRTLHRIVNSCKIGFDIITIEGRRILKENQIKKHKTQNKNKNKNKKHKNKTSCLEWDLQTKRCCILARHGGQRQMQLRILYLSC
jgi:hypothetical protein